MYLVQDEQRRWVKSGVNANGVRVQEAYMWGIDQKQGNMKDWSLIIFAENSLTEIQVRYERIALILRGDWAERAGMN